MFWRRGDVNSAIEATSILIPPDHVVFRDATPNHERIGCFNVPGHITHDLLVGEGVKVEIPVFLPEHEELSADGSVGDSWNTDRNFVLSRPVDEGVWRANTLTKFPYEMNGTEAQPSICAGFSG